MSRPIATVVLCAAAVLAGCGGGGGEAGEPLVSGALTGVYKGATFTPMFGIATVYQGQNLVGLGDGPINCASPQQNDPPPGTTVVVSLPALAAGTYSSVFVQIVHNDGNFDGIGSNDGTVTITAVTATSVTGSVHYGYTDAQQQMYGVSGQFEVSRCPG